MQKIYLVILSLCLSLSSGIARADSIQHMGQSLDHSTQALAHTSTAGMQLASGIIAVPFLFVGEIGQASGEIGDALWEVSTEPLPVTDKVLTIGPSPEQAMADN